MEPIIFWATLSSYLNASYEDVAPGILMTMINEKGNKFINMKESQEWFTIKLDNEAYPAFRIVQADESVIFVVELEQRKITLYKGENDNWIGNAEQDLIDRVGKAIEEA